MEEVDLLWQLLEKARLNQKEEGEEDCATSHSPRTCLRIVHFV